MSDSPNTCHTLLQRAYDLGDDEAWNQLVAHYRRFIYYILGKLQVPSGELEEVAQQVLIRLTKSLPTYDRARSKFRTWLSRVISNTAISHYQKRQQEWARQESFDAAEHLLEPTRATEIEAMVAQEWSTYVSTQAVQRVRRAFKGKAVEVFELGLKEHSAEEIAEETGLSVASVYTLKKRVKKRLYAEIRALIAELER